MSNTTKVNLDGLTLENFRERFGKRFRSPKTDHDAGLTREQAFAKWLTSEQAKRENNE